MALWRKATSEDIPLIFSKLKELQQYSKAPQMKWADDDIAMRALKHNTENERVYIVGDFAVMADWGYPFWYSEKIALIEDFVLRIGNDVGNSVDDVPTALCDIARSKGIDVVVTGDAQGGYISKVYERAGFVLVANQYMKEL